MKLTIKQIIVHLHYEVLELLLYEIIIEEYTTPKKKNKVQWLFTIADN